MCQSGRQPDDAALVADARSQPEKFAVLYERYLNQVYRYCYLRLGSREAAQDATSETFLKALAGIGRYRGGSFAACGQVGAGVAAHGRVRSVGRPADGHRAGAGRVAGRADSGGAGQKPGGGEEAPLPGAAATPEGCGAMSGGAMGREARHEKA